MKKALLIVAAVVVVVVAVLVIAPFLIPVETYKGRIAQQVEKATGRELTLAGDIEVSLLPPAKLSVADVALANRPGEEPADMARLERLEVKVDPLALLGGELRVERFVLYRPVIHLAVDKEGRANWSFGEARAAEAGEGGAGMAAVEDVHLGDVRIVDGTVSYADARSGERAEISQVNLTLSLESLDSPLTADGSLVWNGETVEAKLETGPPRGLLRGAETPVAMDVAAEPITLAYDGRVTGTEPLAAEGRVSLDVPSLKRLAAWAGSPVEAREGTLEAFHLEGRVSAEGERFAFVADSLRLDDIEGKGELGLDVSGAKPRVEGRLDLARLVLTPYMAPATQGAGDGEGGGQAGGEPPAQARQWSDEPLDMSALRQVQADFALTADSIVAGDVKVGRSALDLAIEDGRLVADLNELQLYGGRGVGKLVVDAGGKMPAVAQDLVLEGVAAGPLLTDAAGFERLEGTGDVRLSVKSRGASQKAMVEALSGDGAIKFTDGAIKGINLAAMVRNVKSAYLDAGAGEARKTDFAELSGTFTIERGILGNDDLLMLNPLLRLRGAGKANLPERTVKYRLVPKAVAALKGQGGEAEESGVAVPVIIEGPWHDLSYRPDLEHIVKDVLKDPSKAAEDAKATVESIKEGAKGGLEGVLEGLTGQGGGSQQEGDTGGAPDPGEALKKLFGD